ncbi:glycosyltransferase family 4 protein [Flavobacterium sp. LAR06]|uniref:glycosyltransferase family 4 protein n=1 Tax=Flavobacterium sp. LAR06 TaxID=3064897 RepID=UPI0035BFC178
MKKNVFISFSLGNGSVSDYFILLAEKLKNEYQVIIFSDTEIKEDTIIPSEIIVKYWPSKRPTKIADAFFLFRNIKEYKPVMTISVFGSVNMFLLIGFLCRIKIRIAWIRTLSSQFQQKKRLVYRKSLVYKLATNIISNSEATRADAIKSYFIAKEKIKVLPNSVKNLYSEIKINSSNNLNVITYVGRLHKSKGVSILIEAFYKIHLLFPDFKLIIIGNGEEETNLKKLVYDLGIDSFVDFKGNLSKIEVLENFKKSYMAVIPSLSEAFGYTVIEAMSMKTLVIGSNNTGIKEIIQDNKTGFLFESSNVDDLVKKITFAIQHYELRDKLALQGFTHFKNNYEVTLAADRDLSYFKSLIIKQK